LCLFTTLLLVCPGLAQDAGLSAAVFDADMLVEFNFTHSEITDVIQHLARLTGWSVFYDPAQVRGKVTIITPGKVPLAHAVRLMQGVTRPYGQAIQVLTPHGPQVVPLAAVLATLLQPAAQRDAVVWHSSNASGPQSRPWPCDQYGNASPSWPLWMDVIVDQRRR
jgi:type II secretory pathway component GspD/PulD (secretin)